MAATLIIVHGEKPTPAGDIHPAFVHRLQKTLEIAEEKGVETVLVTGGKTRAATSSEADMGEVYLRNQGFKGTILKESEARSTSENILFTRKLLKTQNIDPDQVYIISSKNREERIKHLYKKLDSNLWPKISFASAENGCIVSRWICWTFGIREFFLYLYQRHDPDESSFFAQLVKYLERNDTPPSLAEVE